MEENTRKQQLTFDKGITNIPSDALCSDNALAESLGLIYENGEHRVIQNPHLLVAGDAQDLENSRLVFIHRFGIKERWLFAAEVQQDRYCLNWYYKDGGTLVKGGTLGASGTQKEFSFSGEDLQNHAFKITSTGKCLVVIDQEGIYYFLWKDNGYSESVNIPQPKFEFTLRPFSPMADPEIGDVGFSKGKRTGILSDKMEDQAKYNDLVIGLYSKSLNQIASINAFCKPFLVRVALQLYDDSYIYISQPVMMFACVTENAHFANYADDYVGISVDSFYLYAKQLTDYTALSDVVKNVSIFVSNGIEPHDLTVDQPFTGWGSSGDIPNVFSDAVYGLQIYDYKNIYIVRKATSYHEAKSFMKKKSRNDIKAELEATSVFFKLCDIGIKPINELTNLKKYIKPHVVQNLTSQEQLAYDDYYSRCPLQSSIGYSYNNRLNISNVHRGFFEGYGYFLPFAGTIDGSRQYQETTPADCDFYVTIATADGNFIVHHREQSKDYQGIYFSYPDSRAKHVVVVKNGYICLDADLTEHPNLNMAYYFKGLPGFEGKEETTGGGSIPKYDNSAKEYLPDHILTSEVNNPFVFKASGYNRVGIGRIIGLSTNTQAMSQGQFGQYPLLVFSETGIYSMAVGNSGEFVSIHPMSREVCNNPCSITQTDGAVFFSSDKGLMVVSGAVVKCVSEQLSGKESKVSGVVELGNFIDYLKSAYIAYDYRDSLLWIFKPNQKTCYVFSIKSGTFGKYTFERNIDGVVNYYPDYIMQDGARLLSLATRPNINLDGTTYSGKLISRPMKLENALALKSIVQFKHIFDFADGATMELKVYASNNLKDWVEVGSRHGVPWKYYRFEYSLSKLKATDRFAGTVLVTQERRTNKLR